MATHNYHEINNQYQRGEIYFNLSQLSKNRSAQQQNNQQVPQWPILKPNPIYSSDNLKYCNTTLNSQIFTFNIRNQQYAALGLKYCGFVIYNLQNPFFPQVELQESFQDVAGQVNGFSLDNYRNLLWVTHSSGNIYQVNIFSVPMSIQLSLQTAQLKWPLILQTLPNINDVILIVCLDEIQVFFNQINQNTNNNSNLSHFIYYKSIIISKNKDIIHVQFDFNNNICLIGCYIQGVLLFKLTKLTSQDIQFESIATIKPSWSYLSRFQLTSQKILYYMGVLQGIFALDLSDCLKYQNKESCQGIIPFYQFHSTSRAGVFFINKQETYLYSQFRQLGIKILDIQSRQIKIFQSLEIEGDVQDIQLSENESFLYYTNTFNFLIYEFQTKIYNFQKPNLLQNIVQMSQEKKYLQNEQNSIDPCCKYDDIRDILFLCRYSQGISIFKKETDGILKNINNIKFQETRELIIDLVFFQNFKIGYIQQNKKGMSIIDFTDPQNPLFIKENITFGVQYPLFIQITCNSKNTLCIVGSQFTGVIIFDIQNLFDPVFQSIFLPQSMDQSIQFGRSSFMYNQDIVFVVIYSFGLVIVDLQDPKNPYEISRIKTDETTFVLITQDNKYCLCTSSFRGLLIIDISNLKDLKLISQVKLFGAAISFKFIQNEQYVIVASYENAGLFLVEIKDKYNPILIQTLRKKQKIGFQEVCLDKGDNQGFISSSRGGVFFLNLKTDISIHLEIYEFAQVKLSNQKQFISIDPNIPLKVGQTIQFNIIPLYQDYPIAVVNAFLYYNYNLQDLKKWMTFKSDKLLLELNINKESLEQGKDGTFLNTRQQVIFQIHKTILVTSFVNDYLKIDEELSKKIFLACQMQEYIGESNMAATTLNPSLKIDIDLDQIYGTTVDSDQKEDIMKFIKYVLQHSIIFQPIDYVITPSLKYDLNDPNSEFIQSTQLSIVMTINIKKLGQGKFVNKTYPGILAIISQQQEEIMLDGDLQKINKILKQKLKFFSSIDQNDISFVVIIDDGVNHLVQQEVSYKNARFISEQKIIQINDESELQRDFNSNYESSIIYILEKFYYKISPNIFQAKDDTDLSYVAQIKNNDGDFVDIPSNFWLQFSKKTFYGTPSSKEFLNVIDIQVNATDNYSFATQKFRIKVFRIPLSYIIQQLFQIGGPLLGLIGLWNYYYLIYNIIYKKYYTFQKETVQVGELYVKQIIINNDNIDQANQILKIFKQIIPIKMIKQQIYIYYSQKKMIEINKLKAIEQQLAQKVQQNDYINSDSYESPRIQQTQNGFDLLQEKSKSNIETYERLSSSPSHLISQKPRYQQRESLSPIKKNVSFSQFHSNNKKNNLQSQNQVQQQEQISMTKQISQSESQRKLDTQIEQKEYNSPITPTVLLSPLNFQKSQALQQRKEIRFDEQKSPIYLFSKTKQKLDSENQIFKFGVQNSENSIQIPVQEQLNLQSQSSLKKKIDGIQKSILQIDEFSQKPIPTLFSPPLQDQLYSKQQISQRNDILIDDKQKLYKNNQNLQTDKQEDDNKLNLDEDEDDQTNKQIIFFDNDGILQIDLIINYFICKTQEQNQKKRFPEKLFQKLQLKNDIVRKTFESLLSEHILKQDSFSYQVFKQIYKKYNKKVTPDWYKNLCEISTHPQEVQKNPLPLIYFKEQILNKEIRTKLLKFKKAHKKLNELEKIPIIIPLIKDVIKGHIFGFITQRLVLNSLSAGESIICKVHKIKQITSLLKKKSNLEREKLNFLQKLKKFCIAQYTEKALIDNSKLPSWISSVDVINNNIFIMGNPQSKDIGQYHIFIYSKQNFILRQFDIEVV